MAIRDRFRRALRKNSVSTGGPTIRHTNTGLTTDSNTSNESSQSDFSFSPRRQSFFSRAFPWGTRRSSRTAIGDSASGDNSDNNDERTPQGTMGLAQQIELTLTRTASEAEQEIKAEKKRQRKARNKTTSVGSLHPRDKPLTAQNLKHQAMLGTWSWDEAAGNSRVSFVDGISPCCTRPPSIHHGNDNADAGRGEDDYFDLGGSSSGHGVASAPTGLAREY